MARTRDPPTPPPSCYPLSSAWTIPAASPQVSRPPPSLICSPHGSLSNLYKRQSRCCLKPSDDSHYTQNEVHTPHPSLSPPAVSATPPHLLDLTASSATLASLVGTEHPKLLWTSGPLHFPYQLPVLFFPTLPRPGSLSSIRCLLLQKALVLAPQAGSDASSGFLQSLCVPHHSPNHSACASLSQTNHCGLSPSGDRSISFTVL